MKSKAAGCCLISTLISSIVLLCVSSILIIIKIIIIITIKSLCLKGKSFRAVKKARSGQNAVARRQTGNTEGKKSRKKFYSQSKR